MKNLLIHGAKFLSKTSRVLNMGNGSTWPGHIALQINSSIIEELLKDAPTKVIFVVGTNGKTTTSHMLSEIFKENKKSVLQNVSGANLLNGVVSTLILGTNNFGQLTADYAIFEIDENNLSLILEHITPTAILALNLFRDQLDRYGELDSIAKKWNTSFKKLTSNTTLILNADDPLIAYLAKDVQAKVQYFGLSDKEKSQKALADSADSTYCPQCGHKLHYIKIFYSHLGIWDCPNCHVKSPQPQLTESIFPLPGMYNKYNTLAAVLAAQNLEVNQPTIDAALKKVTPAFGRQETLNIDGKKVQIFLSKNPTSMNESLRTITQMQAKNVLLVLNDRIPDGRDVSWIWDIDMEEFLKSIENVTISGDRTYDMGLRLHYADNKNFVTEPQLKVAIHTALDKLNEHQTLFILPTYSAMLDVRKILTGRKIL